MSPKQALTVIRKSSVAENERQQALSVLQEAVNKRTALPPINRMCGNYLLSNCPSCGKDIYSIYGACRFCGQLIDWSIYADKT